jgi:hypothetical protein
MAVMEIAIGKPPINQMPILSLMCMKKGLVFIWLVIYTCISTGFAVSTHFCMDEKQSLELGAVKIEVCGKCGMSKQEKDGCCRDEIKIVKLQQDTHLAKLLMPTFELMLPVAFLSPHLFTPFQNFTKNFNAFSFQPPPLHSEDLCVTNSSFRI